MSAPRPEQLSGEWKTDVGTSSNEKQDVRTVLMTKAALLALRVKNETQLDAKLRDTSPTKEIKSLAELGSIPKLELTIKSGDYLQKILKEYFSSAGVTDAGQLRKEVNASLYFLSKEGKDSSGRTFNVDLLNTGAKLTIENGRLSIESAKGVTIAKDVMLRPGDGSVVIPPRPKRAPHEDPPEVTPDPEAEARQRIIDMIGGEGGVIIPPRPRKK